MGDLVWGDNRGLNTADPATRLEGAAVTDAHNVLLEPSCLGRRRPSTAAVTLTSGPSSPIVQLFRHQPGATKLAGAGGAEIFALSGTTSIHRYANSAWTTPTMTKQAGTTGWSDRPYGVTFNGKLYFAWNSTQNRMNVYDGTEFRKVGIAASSAPSVADTGSGSYAATLRYYKLRFETQYGSTKYVRSELSAATSFTPSGTGSGAQISRGTVPDNATHWYVYGSADGVSYYDISGARAVAFTTYSDTADPATYSDNEIAPTAGLYVPPPSCKYLLTAYNRLFCAGAWETSAASTETAVRNSRVWFTQTLGALDNTGEDEAIAQSVDQKDWIDCGEDDSDAIVGLGGPLDGIIYVFKDRSVWRLIPTGLDDTPFRAELVTASFGATWQDSIALGEDGQGNPALYFMSQTGPKRIVSGVGVEDIGPDVRDTTATTYSSVDDTPIVIWDLARRMMWWIAYGGLSAYAFQPQFEERTSGGVRGGWTRHTISPNGSAINAAVIYELSSVFVPFLGGEGSGSSAVLATLSGASHQDAGSTAYTPSVVSGMLQPTGRSRFRCRPPMIEWEYPGAATAISVSLASAIGGPTATTGTSTDTTTSSTYSQSIIQETLEGIQIGDVTGLQITLTWDTAVAGSERPRIHRIVVPVAPEAA